MIGVAMILLYIIISKVKDCQKINYDEDEKSMGTYINVISEAYILWLH